MIHRIGGHGKISNAYRLARDDGLLPEFFQFNLPGENRTGQQHLAGALGAIHWNFRVGVVQQPGMVGVGVGKENGINRWPSLKKPRHFRHMGGTGWEMIPCEFGAFRVARIIQRQAGIQNDSRVSGAHFDATTANFFRAAMNDEFHFLSS